MPAITVYSSLASVQLYSAVAVYEECKYCVTTVCRARLLYTAVQMVAAPTAAAHQLSRVQTLALETSPDT